MRIEEIINKAFTRSFMGYDMQEVDQFLDEIIDRLEHLESERQEMLAAMEYLLKRLEEGGELPAASGRKALGPGESKTGRKRLKTGRPPVAMEMEINESAPSLDELIPEMLAEVDETYPEFTAGGRKTVSGEKSVS